MSRFLAPQPLIFNGKLREVVNLDKVCSFTFRRATGNNYGYIRFCFDKSNEQLWAYPDDASLRDGLLKLYAMLDLPWEDDMLQ